MNIEVIGLSHKTAPIDIRERLAFSNASLKKALLELKKQPDILEGVILSTCNRTEIYARGEDAQRINTSLTNFLSTFHCISTNNFKNHLYHYNNSYAIKHLFRVSSSLDSQILGENQILAQVKEAYFQAKETGAISRILAFLFEEAIKIGKLVRSQTQIGRGAVSIGSAAVELAKKIFENFAHKKILLIGAGKIGELAASHLYDKGMKLVFVANRTFTKAQELAERFNGQAVEFDKLYDLLNEVDIVVSSVSAPHLLVTKNKIKPLMLKRKQRPIFFIDLGLPRNIDPQINEIDNVYVYNLDDLKKVKDANLNERLKEASKVEFLINNHLEKVEFKLKELLKNELQ